MVASWPHVRILACAVLLVVPSLPFLRHRVVTEDRVLIAELPVNGPLSMGRGISSLWGVQFSPLGGLAISRFLDQRLRFSAVDHDA